jgi:hypothetical protein
MKLPSKGHESLSFLQERIREDALLLVKGEGLSLGV